MDGVQSHANGAAHSSQQHQKQGKEPKSKKTTWLKSTLTGIIVVLIVAALVIGGLLLYRLNNNALIDGGKYQAVFLTSGQVYFGKLEKVNRDTYRLTKVFYIQAKTDTQTDQENPQDAAGQDTSDIELVKLGGEIHGPQDEMIINRDQVLFYENLKAEGRVSETIKKFLEPKDEQ